MGGPLIRLFEQRWAADEAAAEDNHCVCVVWHRLGRQQRLEAWNIYASMLHLTSERSGAQTLHDPCVTPLPQPWLMLNLSAPKIPLTVHFYFSHWSWGRARDCGGSADVDTCGLSHCSVANIQAVWTQTGQLETKTTTSTKTCKYYPYIHLPRKNMAALVRGDALVTYLRESRLSASVYTEWSCNESKVNRLLEAPQPAVRCIFYIFLPLDSVWCERFRPVHWFQFTRKWRPSTRSGSDPGRACVHALRSVAHCCLQDTVSPNRAEMLGFCFLLS